jgi:hypothetical protein
MDISLVKEAIEKHMASSSSYGSWLDEIIQTTCADYDQEDFLRVAFAAALEIELSTAWIGLWSSMIAIVEMPSSYSPLLSYEIVEDARSMFGLSHQSYERVSEAIGAVSGPVDLLRLMLACLDQAGVSVAGQGRVRRLLLEDAELLEGAELRAAQDRARIQKEAFEMGRKEGRREAEMAGGNR